MRSIPAQALQQRGSQHQFAMVQPKNPAHGTSAQLQTADDFRVNQISHQLAKTWQLDAYLYYRIVGQVGKVHNMTANTVASGELRPVWTDPDSGNERTLAEILDDDAEDISPELRRQAEAVRRVHDAFIGPIGGQRELLRKAALNLRIAGEAFLVASPTEGDNIAEGDSPGLMWEFLSPIEIDPDKYGHIERKRTGGGVSWAAERLDEENYIARIWISDPEHSEDPDCAMKRAIPDCRQYVKLRDMIDASADSRIPAGIIKIPEELESVGFPQDEDDPEEQGAMPFSEALVRHMKAPFQNPKSAARFIPVFAIGEAEALKGLEKMDLGDEQNAAWASELREKVLTSISQILDNPPEQMEGMSEVNHWTGFSIDAQFNSNVVIPLGNFIAEWTTISYLQNMLVVFEEFDEDDASCWKHIFDASNITAKADRGVTATRLGDRDLLSDEAQVIANGFEQSDMPSEEEMKVKRAMKFMREMPQYAPQFIQLVPGFEDFELEAVETSTAVEVEVDEGPIDDEPSGQSGGDPRTGDGEPPRPDGSPTAPAPEDTTLVNRLLGAADATMERALERAGARCISRINLNRLDSSKLPAADRLRSANKREAMALLSTADMAALGVTPESLLEGAWDEFALKAQGWIQPWVVSRTGINGSISAETSRGLANDICAVLHSLALADRGSRIYEDGLRVPEQAIVGVLESVGKVSL